MSRKLLYHRGLDDDVATYVTDYVSGSMCLAFGLATAVLAMNIKRSKEKVRGAGGKSENQIREPNDSRLSLECKIDFDTSVSEPANDNPQTADCDVTEDYDAGKARARRRANDLKAKVTLAFLFSLCGMMLISGGIVHCRVQRIQIGMAEDQDDLNADEYVSGVVRKFKAFLPFYLLWQLANVFGGMSASLFVLLVPLTLDRESSEVKGRPCAGSEVTSRSRSSTNNSVALLLSPFVKKNKNSNEGRGKIWLKIALQILALFVAVLNVTYHVWNVTSYLGAIRANTEVLSKIRQTGETPIYEIEMDVFRESQLEGGFEHQYSNERKLKSLTDYLQSLNTKPFEYKGTESDDKDSSDFFMDLSSSEFRPFDFNSMWGMEGTTTLLGLSLFIYSCFVTSLVLRDLKEKDKNCCDQTGCSETKHHHVISCEAEDRRSDHNDPTTSGRKFKLFSRLGINSIRCISVWMLLASGLIQFGLSSRCGAENAMEELGCPFPDYFNHNSVYHVTMGTGMMLLFVSEALASMT